MSWRGRGAAVGGLLACLGGALPGRAAPPPEPPPEQNAGRRSYSQHAYTSLRQGSLLATDATPYRPLDLRSELELRRDTELVKHYGRLGQLDAIAELADRARALTLQEKVDTTRRSETQRFYDAMQNFRALILRKLYPDGP